MPWRCKERVKEQAFNDPDKKRKNLVSVVAVVVVVQVKKFGLQHSITVRVWDDLGKEHSCPGRFQVSSNIYPNSSFIIYYS